MKGIKSLLSISLLALLAVACGGGSSGGGNGGGGGGNGASTSGVFVDSVVTGLRYESTTHTGTTDADGKFTCKTGEVVEFYLPATGGNVYVGEVQCRAVVSPIELVTDGAKTVEDGLAGLSAGEEMVVKRALRLLQTLDSDGDASNGITILQTEVDAMVTALAITDRDEDLAEALQNAVFDFDQALTDVAAALPAIGGNARVAVSESDATAHFTATISSCTASSCAPNQPATRSCDVENGTGMQTLVNGTYGACTVVSCNQGYSEAAGACVEDEVVAPSTICLVGKTLMASSVGTNGIVDVTTGEVLSGVSNPSVTTTLIVLTEGSSSAKVYRPTFATTDSDWMTATFNAFNATYVYDEENNSLVVSNISYSNAGMNNDYLTFFAPSVSSGGTVSASAQSIGLEDEETELQWSVTTNCALPQDIVQ